MSRRVLISGLGAVSPFGYGADALWNGLVEGRSAIARIRRFDPSGFHCQLAAEAADFQAKDHVPKHYRKAVKVMARDIELAVGAAKSAVEHARITTKAIDPDAAPTYDPARVGCHIGAGLIACEVPELSMALATSVDDDGAFSYKHWGEGAINNLQPLWLLKYLPNMLACHVTILHDAQGPSNTITCNEASGLLSLGEAMRIIQRGDADLGFAGSAESKINPMGIMRIDLAGRLAPVSVAPDEAIDGGAVVRPYCTDATGTVLGEGAGIVLLEASETARARTASPVAEVLGFGAGHCPGSHDPLQRSIGLLYAVENAIEDAGIHPDQIDAIVPHASGTPSLDLEEIHAFEAVFGDRLPKIEIVTSAPNIGDCMAGNGGLAACIAALCLHHQSLPVRLCAGRPDPRVLAGPSPARKAALKHILVCTNALGGQNAAAVLRAL